VQAGQIAMQQASNGKIRDFGQHMVDDHSRANDQLRQLAAQKGIPVPTDLDARMQAQIDQLNKASGAAFDQMYVAGQLADHKEAIDVFQKEINSGQDADLKSFATQTLPTLQHHLDMVEQLPGALAPDTGKPMYNNTGNLSGQK
jgi:putative membrane protein